LERRGVMAKLAFKKLQNHGNGRFNLMIDHKVKELVCFYGLPSLVVFESQFKTWIETVPQLNGYSIRNAYKMKIANGVCQIWKHYAGSDKDPILIYEIKEVDHE
jgi:hypothetical protein